MMNKTNVAALNGAENTTFSQESDAKLAEMDAFVDRFIATCYGIDENSPENALEKEQINANKENYGKICKIKGKFEQINANKENYGNGDGKICKNKESWFVPGNVLRTVLRFSTIKQSDLCKDIGITRQTFASILRKEVASPQITKIIARKLELNSPAELWDYYEQVPESVKEAIKYDWRISRPITGIPLSTDVYRAAMALGRMNEVFAALDIRDGR